MRCAGGKDQQFCLQSSFRDAQIHFGTLDKCLQGKSIWFTNFAPATEFLAFSSTLVKLQGHVGTLPSTALAAVGTAGMRPSSITSTSQNFF